RKQEKLRKNISIHEPPQTPLLFSPFLGIQKSLVLGRYLGNRNLRVVASMGGFSGATGLPVYREEDDEELFETSSSISGDSDDEDQFSD
ncbi:hypothetical protein G0P98_27780, partial [Yangia sp. PrR004]|nr:hypothetical protein [Salipiger sp. PrR004]